MEYVSNKANHSSAEMLEIQGKNSLILNQIIELPKFKVFSSNWLFSKVDCFLLLP